MDAEKLRSRWEARETWNDGVFDSLERFVETKPTENIEKFVETGDLDDLYGEHQLPSPKPSSKHQEYMQAYAETLV